MDQKNDEMDNLLKREKTKSSLIKQELKNITSEIKDIQSTNTNSKNNNIDKNKELLSKILNSEEDISTPNKSENKITNPKSKESNLKINNNDAQQLSGNKSNSLTEYKCI